MGNEKIIPFDMLTAEAQQPYFDLATELLSHLHACTRVWEAWRVGTMTEEDFVCADEDSELVFEKAYLIYNFTQSQIAKSE